jgi:hypothetical protein
MLFFFKKKKANIDGNFYTSSIPMNKARILFKIIFE